MHQDDPGKTTNVHEALALAAQRDRDSARLTHCNFKVDPVKKEMADRICEQQGTTISGFLRACIDSLVLDYLGKSAFQKLETSLEG